MKNVIMNFHVVLHSQGSLPGRHARSKFQLWMGGGEGSNSDNATSPDETINHGRHSENISVVDDTRENVHFDGVWYTQRRKTQIC